MDARTVCALLNRIRKQKPLIHNITNIVVANFSANGLLALGASPFMASSENEAAEAAKMADALVLNMGTVDEAILKAMVKAGRSANAHGTPVIFDPVGAGATPYRKFVAKSLLEELKMTMIRGNAAEISQLIGEQGEVKGVDAGDLKGNPAEWAKRAAKQWQTVVIATGKDDVISDGSKTFLVHNGHPILTQVTGTGCLLSAVAGAFAAVEKDPVKAAVSAVTFYGVAAEIAAEKSGKQGPGSFQVEFINQLALVSEAEILRHGSFEQIE